MQIGKITQVMGPVVDVHFDETPLPYIQTALQVDNHGKKVVIEKPQLLLFYNILCVGIILFPVMQPIELFFRINYLFMFFQILIAAYCFYFTFSQKKRINIGLRCLGFLVLLFYINNIEGKFLISDPYKTMYIWDAGNLKSLPIDLFMDE